MLGIDHCKIRMLKESSNHIWPSKWFDQGHDQGNHEGSCQPRSCWSDLACRKSTSCMRRNTGKCNPGWPKPFCSCQSLEIWRWWHCWRAPNTWSRIQWDFPSKERGRCHRNPCSSSTLWMRVSYFRLLEWLGWLGQQHWPRLEVVLELEPELELEQVGLVP